MSGSEQTHYSPCHAWGIVALLLMCSCERSQNTYFPMTADAYWEYSLEYLVPPANVLAGKVVERINGLETIGGNDYFRSTHVTSGIPGAESTQNYVRIGAEGVYAIDGGNRDAGEYLVAPLRLNEGVSWDSSGPTGNLSCNVEAVESAELLIEDSRHASVYSARATG